MVLKFCGGIKPQFRSKIGSVPTEYTGSAGAVCFYVPENSDITLECGPDTRVLRGSLLAQINDTPVYSSVSGNFRGILEISGNNYLTVMSDGKNETIDLFEPETRNITDITGEEITELARRYGIIDTRSGRPLWKMMREIAGKCKRVITDCTDCTPESAISYRLCLEKPESVVGGSKILLHALNAGKGVIAVEEYRNSALSALSEKAKDPLMFAFALVEEKMPYTDRALIQAVYNTELRKGESASDRGCLIIGAETALALYECIRDGFPQTDRYISACGEGFSREKNLCVPAGMLIKDIEKLCGGIAPHYVIAENSLLENKKAEGALSSSARALVACRPVRKEALPCIDCGECRKVCMARINPADIMQKNVKIRLDTAKKCIDCRCCDSVCPCYIPLYSMIENERSEYRKGSEAVL